MTSAHNWTRETENLFPPKRSCQPLSFKLVLRNNCHCKRSPKSLEPQIQFSWLLASELASHESCNCVHCARYGLLSDIHCATMATSTWSIPMLLFQICTSIIFERKKSPMQLRPTFKDFREQQVPVMVSTHLSLWFWLMAHGQSLWL